MIEGLLKRVRNKMLFSSLKKEDRLYVDFPLYNGLVEQSNEHKEKFRQSFNHYVSEVSIDTMAISLELAATLYTLCLLKKPKHLLDVGSGYSSFVFRYYQKHHDPSCTVCSVDDDAQWLGKTKSYLSSQGVSVELIYTLQDFERTNQLKFDLILHDMNFVEVRQNYLNLVIGLLKEQGALVLDDVHKPEYLKVCVDKVRAKKLPLYSLYKATKDKFDRFSILVIKSA